MNNKKIVLSGLGEIDEETEMSLAELAKEHNVKLYPSYYDWCLEGLEDDIEKITQSMWSMPKDQWSENALNAEEIERPDILSVTNKS